MHNQLHELITGLDWQWGVPDMVSELVQKICQEQQLVFAQDFDGSVNGYPRVKLIPESWPSQEPGEYSGRKTSSWSVISTSGKIVMVTQKPANRIEKQVNTYY